MIGDFAYNTDGTLYGGLAAHLRPNGDLVWMRHDTAILDPNIKLNKSQLVALGHLSSGSIVACGGALVSAGGLYDEAWLIKFTPDGCTNPLDCATSATYEADTTHHRSAFRAWEVYPNPATDHLLLMPDDDHAGEEAVFSLYDLSGTLIKSTTFEVQQNKPAFISLTSLPLGVYAYSVQIRGQQMGTGKVLVMW